MSDKPCYTHYENGKGYYIPGCIGGAVYGRHACTCGCREKTERTRDQLEKEMAEIRDRLWSVELALKIMKGSVTQ